MALVFEVDGTSLFPNKIQKIQYSREPIWSSNTRRNASAKMTGKIKAWKWKLTISYAPSLKQSEYNTVLGKLANYTEWHTVRFTNDVGNTITASMYVGEMSSEPYWFVNGQMLYQSVGFSLIER